jgi:hypothetical protein
VEPCHEQRDVTEESGGGADSVTTVTLAAWRQARMREAM